MNQGETAGRPAYAYKPSLTGAMRSFELGEHGLIFRAGFANGIWPYRELAALRLSYRPMSMLPNRFRLDIRHASGKTLTLMSASWTSIAQVTSQKDDYRAFVAELHRRLASQGGTLRCMRGVHPVVYALACAAFGLVLVALGGLLLRAIALGSLPAMVFILGFAAFFIWTISRWLRLNRPGLYDPDRLPEALLP